MVIGANVGECAPITTDYIWRCRDNGGKLIVADPRMTPISRNADLYLPVRPGTDLALLIGMLHVILRDKLQNDEISSRAHHAASSAGGIACKAWDPRTGRGDDRRASRSHREGGALVRRGAIARSRCTRAAWSTIRRAWRIAWRVINLALATGNIGREGAAADDHRPGQRAGWPRARPEVRPIAGAALASTIRKARAHVAKRLGRHAGRDSAGRA